MRLAVTDERLRGAGDDPNGHSRFRRDFHMPPWYIQEIRGRGKRYESYPPGFSDLGEVIFHAEENLVFVGLSHG